MKKSIFSVAVATAMFASLFSVAGAATVVPAEPNIVDPTGDANTTSGNNVGPADASTVGDLMAVWFSSDKSSLTVHIQTERPAPASSGTIYEVFADQTEGFTGYMNGCLRFAMLIPAGGTPGGPYQGPPLIKLVDRCNDGTSLFSNGVEGEYVIETLDDGTGLLSATFPRSYSPLLAPGEVLTQPQARSSVPIGSDQEAPGAGRVGFVSFRIDDTVVGTDFALTEGKSPSAGEPPKTDPGPKDPPPVKNGCKKKKGKGMKKGCDKGKGPKEEPKGCDAYIPGESGAGLETLKITDKATAEAPVTVQFNAGVGLGGPVIAGVPPDETTHNYHNIQIDSSAAEAGLYVRLDFSDRRDYDLYLDYPSGQEATHSGDFNGAFGSPVFTCGNATTGCSSGSNFEQVNGIRTADCQGWTTDTVAFLTEGGDVTLSFWLGEIQNDPAPPA